MQSGVQEFLKQFVGFTTILIVALIIIGLAGYADSEFGEQIAQPAQEATK